MEEAALTCTLNTSPRVKERSLYRSPHGTRRSVSREDIAEVTTELNQGYLVNLGEDVEIDCFRFTPHYYYSKCHTNAREKLNQRRTDSRNPESGVPL